MQIVGEKRRETGLSQPKAAEDCGFPRNTLRDCFKRNKVEWDEAEKKYFIDDNTIITTTEKEEIEEDKIDVLTDDSKVIPVNKVEEKIDNTTIIAGNNTDMATANFFANLLESAGSDKVLKFFKNIDYFISHLEKGHVIDDGSISFRNHINKSTSLRIDEGIYEVIKERAIRDNISISDILNKACEDYLKNYL